MKEEQLYRRLNSGRLSKTEIDELVNELMDYPNLTEMLLQEVFRQDKEHDFNASWVFDHLMRKKLKYLLPHFEFFSKELKNLVSESCLRPMAHTCELITIAYFKGEKEFVNVITNQQLERLVDVCFDWFIGNHKVATKVFAMSSLFELGKRFDWIYPELKIILETTIGNSTAGYKSRGKKTLEKLIAKGI
ncbi:hypothetical protein [Croceitalea vernalis]|uniref:Adenylosuccinate lyase n=1 Tax=Croceitalea vernalis TaxID=3075599 RepID=A0ABU3BI70_9FLAO|nr:hypothetical protein [Croceitalea sp. P007]MDT0621863.1 hypothetical protein [Croceitalea sp. P007]